VSFIEMTQVAGIRPTRGEAGLHRRTADLMASNRFQQAVGRVRHVAVVTGTAAGLGGVVGMRRHTLGDRRMTLKARPVALCLRLQLIVRPLSVGPFVSGESMHRMTGETGQRVLVVFGVSVAR
jgi:hypothetical protein